MNKFQHDIVRAIIKDLHQRKTHKGLLSRLYKTHVNHQQVRMNYYDLVWLVHLKQYVKFFDTKDMAAREWQLTLQPHYVNMPWQELANEIDSSNKYRKNPTETN